VQPEGNPDAGLMVRFWMDALKNEAKSSETGTVVYDEVPWIEIKVPGERDTVAGPVHLMQPDPRQRFPQAWAKFQSNHATEGLTGTLLRETPFVTRGDVEALAYHGIKTVEQLSSVSDGNIGNIPGGMTLRTKARAFLKAATEQAPVQKMAEELAKRDEQIKALQEQVKELGRAKGR
jgi:hypothetical protein